MPSRLPNILIYITFGKMVVGMGLAPSACNIRGIYGRSKPLPYIKIEYSIPSNSPTNYNLSIFLIIYIYFIKSYSAFQV